MIQHLSLIHHLSHQALQWTHLNNTFAPHHPYDPPDLSGMCAHASTHLWHLLQAHQIPSSLCVWSALNFGHVFLACQPHPSDSTPWLLDITATQFTNHHPIELFPWTDRPPITNAPYWHPSHQFPNPQTLCNFLTQDGWIEAQIPKTPQIHYQPSLLHVNNSPTEAPADIPYYMPKNKP